MFKKSMESLLKTQLDDDKLVVKTLVLQDLIWPDYQECRLFLESGEVYSAIFIDGDKTTDFVFCPNKEASK